MGGVTIKVTLDKTEIVPSNPGDGTPEIVVMYRGGREIGSATLQCALGEGELMGNDGHSVELTETHMKFLDKCNAHAATFLWS